MILGRTKLSTRGDVIFGMCPCRWCMMCAGVARCTPFIPQRDAEEYRRICVMLSKNEAVQSLVRAAICPDVTVFDYFDGLPTVPRPQWWAQARNHRAFPQGFATWQEIERHFCRSKSRGVCGVPTCSNFSHLNMSIMAASQTHVAAGASPKSWRIPRRRRPWRLPPALPAPHVPHVPDGWWRLVTAVKSAGTLLGPCWGNQPCRWIASHWRRDTEVCGIWSPASGALRCCACRSLSGIILGLLGTSWNAGHGMETSVHMAITLKICQWFSHALWLLKASG